MTNQATLQERKARFEQFAFERLPVLNEFAQLLGFEQPERILISPASLLSPVSDWLMQQDIAEEDRIWIATRVGYFIGELLVTELSGSWQVCEIPTSRYWSRYVVGGFASLANDAAIVDPLEVAMACVDQPRGRSLEDFVKEVIVELRAA